jgi:16S rRNA (guanine966-N2)-methyltransferase
LVVEKNILSQLNFKNFDSKFDIIFMDPPYKEKSLNKIIIDIIDAKIIKDNGIVIIHRHKKEKDEFPKKFQIIEEKIYGISRVLFGNCS